MAEPFLLIGEVENHIRRVLDGRFSGDQLSQFRDPGDSSRAITGVADLTFGEYIRLLETPTCWPALDLKIDRGVFVGQLKEIREIRNDVMHFDPDGVSDRQLRVLRQFVRFLQNLQDLTS